MTVYLKSTNNRMNIFLDFCICCDIICLGSEEEQLRLSFRTFYFVIIFLIKYIINYKNVKNVNFVQCTRQN